MNLGSFLGWVFHFRLNNMQIQVVSAIGGGAPIKVNLEDKVKKEIEIHAYFAENQIPLEQARKITK